MEKNPQNLKQDSSNLFNRDSRKKNMLRSSAVGAGTYLLKILVSIVSRVFFLRVLSVDYLGISGLFSNILLILSLAELGVTTAIVYRFYEPINSGDVVLVGRLMHFFRNVYRVIALVVLALGLAVIPFLPDLLKDSADLPAGLNLTAVYLLYLFNTVSSYFFVYKQTLLSADQKNYLVSGIQTGAQILAIIAQTAALLCWRSYMLFLAIGILVPLIINYAVSLWITKKYRPVFEVTERLTKAEKREIFLETKASLLHKVGNTILNGTDSLVLTKMVGLTATGLYSNYSMVLQSLLTSLTMLLGNFVSSVGNARVNLSKAEYYALYKKLNFIGLWLSSVTAVCLFVLINDFIALWLGKDFVLDRFTVICLCLQYYFSVARLINSSFTNAWNWFKKDQLRPLIEAALNLGISIVLANKIGIAGVFLGTVISFLLTVGWREPYILFRFEFMRPHREYWGIYLLFFALTLAMAALCSAIRELAFPMALGSGMIAWLGWLAMGLGTFVFSNLILWLLFRRRKEMEIFRQLLDGIRLRRQK